MEYIITDSDRMAIGYLNDMTSIDIDIGETNDFELMLSRSYAERLGVGRGSQFFVPGTEFGGIIEDIQSDTSYSGITYRGYTWRGFLDQIILQPPTGQAYLTVSGDANQIIRQVLGNGLGLLFEVPKEISGINISRYQFRYDTALSGLSKMLEKQGARLNIKTLEGMNHDPFRVLVSAVKASNYSEELQYDGDDNINVTVRDYGRGINHLICLGAGELAERTVIHLYAQLDGSIGTKQYYKGIDERTAVYDYSSVTDDAELLSAGTEHLKELMDYRAAEMSIDEVNLEIGDIVSARDRGTKIMLSRPVTNKVFEYANGIEIITHKLKGQQEG